jgi:hypothetical protein
VAGQGIFGLMGNEYAGGIYIVVATKDGHREYWAAAVPRERVLEEVRLQVPHGWALALTDRRLTLKQMAELKIRPNSVRKLKEVP